MYSLACLAAPAIDPDLLDAKGHNYSQYVAVWCCFSNAGGLYHAVPAAYKHAYEQHTTSALARMAATSNRHLALEHAKL